MIALALASIGLVTASAAVQFAAWRAPAPLGGGWTEPLANAMHVFNVPGWGVVLLTLGYPRQHAFPLMLGISAISAACYVVGFWITWRLARLGRDALRARAARVRHAEASSPEPDHADPTRRRVVVGGLALATGLPVLGVAHSTGIEPFQLVTRRYRVPVAGLPAHWDGFRIVQVTDTHLGPRVPAWHVRAAVERAIALRPGLIALTGDYIHHGFTRVQEAAELLEPLVATGVPVLGVLGNHDHYTGRPAEVRRALESVGVRTLHNTHTYLAPGARLTPGPVTGGIAIAGIDDPVSGRPNLPVALGGIDPSLPCVLLSHGPDIAESPQLRRADGSSRVDLVIAGHTHGGHVLLPWVGRPGVRSRFGQKYAHGLVQGPACPVVISAGVGMSILPLRVGVPPEIVLIELTPA